MWSTRRKIIYAAALVLGISALVIFLLRNVLFPAPTCFDHKKNGYELDIDCGGSCALKCTQEVKPLSVVWSKALRVEKGLYDLVAFLDNTNIDNASPELGYTFTVYDASGQVVKTFSGKTTAPLDGRFPIILPNVPLENPPANIAVTLFDGPHYAVAEKPTSPTVRIVERRFEPGAIPRVYATITNTKHQEIYNLPVQVLLFDDRDNVFADAQTVIPFLSKEATKEIVFTWKEQLPGAPARIGIYPFFNPFEAIGY